jgi:uncharacterized protein YciI
MMVMVVCDVDPQLVHLRASLLEAHRTHMSSRSDSLTYGGVVEDDDSTLQRVVYFLVTRTESDAREFVSSDPYATLYRSVELTPFHQRIPPPA